MRAHERPGYHRCTTCSRSFIPCSSLTTLVVGRFVPWKGHWGSTQPCAALLRPSDMVMCSPGSLHVLETHHGNQTISNNVTMISCYDSLDSLQHNPPSFVSPSLFSSKDELFTPPPCDSPTVRPDRPPTTQRAPAHRRGQSRACCSAPPGRAMPQRKKQRGISAARFQGQREHGGRFRCPMVVKGFRARPISRD